MTLDYISYSQFNTYTKCPRSWYLSKVRKAEETQTWYLPIGTAVHSMIEYHLDPKLPDSPSAEDFFFPLIEKQMEIEPDLSRWMAGGPEAAPITHNKALQMVSDCFEKAVQELEDIEVWEVEYDATGRLPGLEVPIKAYVDIIGEHKKKGPMIIDWKTGSTKPDNFQLQTYAALLRTNSEYAAEWWGRYVMLSPSYTSTTRPVDLSKVDPAEVGAKYQAVVDAINSKKYRANAGFGCKFCYHKENCLARAGLTERAEYYDKSAEDGYPF